MSVRAQSVALLFLAVCVIAPLGGCKHKKNLVSPAAATLAEDGAQGDVKEMSPERMLVWTGYVRLQVRNIQDAAREATALAEKAGGYVEQNVEESGGTAELRMRIPAKAFHEAIGSLAALGKVRSSRVDGRDVTAEYVDVEALLKNKIALRDSLKELLAKASDVKDILAIETELNRVQADVDSMEGRIKVLKEQVDLATITLSLERGKIYGPFGYFFKGLWWGIEKLFVIRK